MSHNKEPGMALQVLFDGHCGLCNGLVSWLLLRDRHHRLHFVAADTELGATLLARYGRVPADAARTILVIREGSRQQNPVLIRSAAVLALLKELSAPWPSVALVLRWVPLPLRDAAYAFVARCRYSIWGRTDTCPISVSGNAKRSL